MILPGRTHNKKVEEVKRILLDLNLPVLPLNVVKSGFYIPDIITRINTRFIPMDFINSRERVSFDIGGLCLLYNKDIVDFCLAVIDDKLWNDYLHDFRKAKLNLPSKLTMIPMKEVREFFANLTNLHFTGLSLYQS